MKIKITSLLLSAMIGVAVLAGLSSCKKDPVKPNPEPGAGEGDTTHVFTASVDTLIFEVGGGEQSVDVTARLSGWTSVKAEGADWLSVSPMSGDTSVTAVKVTAVANTAEMPRTAHILFTQAKSGKMLRVGITQHGVLRVFDRASDSAALIAIYKNLGGKDWGTVEDGDGGKVFGDSRIFGTSSRADAPGSRIDGVPWKLTDSFSKWGGVTTRVIDGQLRVVGLNLNFPNGIKGRSFPVQMFDLRALEDLSLDCSKMQDCELPQEFVLLSSLQRVEFASASTVTWKVSPLVSMMTALREIYFYMGNMSVEDFGRLYALPNLEQLYIQSGAMRGALPDGISKMTKLKGFSISGGANVSGLPADIGRLSELETFNVVGCKKLTELPVNVDWMNLKTFSISNSGIKMFPANFKDIATLQMFDVEMQEIADINLTELLGKMSELVYIKANGNGFTGSTAFLKGKSKLLEVNVEGNKLSGQLNLIGNLDAPVLEVLTLSNNTELSGTLTGISKAPMMYSFGCSNTKLGGEIPAEIGMNKKLNFLTIIDAQLEGNIPIELVKDRAFNIFNISNNNLGGVLTDEVLAIVSKWSAMAKEGLCIQRGPGFKNCPAIN